MRHDNRCIYCRAIGDMVCHRCNAPLKMKTKLLSRDRLPQAMGGNPLMRVETDRFGTIEVMRQGGIGIWAFLRRMELTRENEAIFDRKMDELWCEGGE